MASSSCYRLCSSVLFAHHRPPFSKFFAVIARNPACHDARGLSGAIEFCVSS
jgi:hypothetical protein